MAKFKIGDKVKILDGSEIKDYTGRWATGMNKYVGKTATIESINEQWSDGRCSYVLDIDAYVWDERGLEFVDEDVKEETEEKSKVKVEVDKKANKSFFLDVAAKVAVNKFHGICAKHPELIMLLGAYAAAIAEELFEE